MNMRQILPFRKTNTIAPSLSFALLRMPGLPFPLDFVTLIALGGALGFFGGLFGIGGGILAIPLLALGFGMEQSLAQGTALVMMAPNLLLGWWRYGQRHPVPWARGIGIALAATVTTWLTARLATGLDPRTLRLAFCAFLLVLAVRLLRHRHHRAADGTASTEAVLHPRWLPLVGVVGGGSMGLLGIGGGLLATPILTGAFGQRQTMAQSLSLALVAPSSVIALAAYGGAGQVDWTLGLALAAGGLLTVSAGVAVAHRLPEARLRGAFAWMLAATAAWLLFGSLAGR